MKKLISIVTPTYNEVNNIKALYLAIVDIWDSNPKYDFEMIVIDNFSSDGTIEVLKSIAMEDKRVKVILNSANFGHLKSPYWAMLNAYGDAVIFMASDFQDPVALLPDFISRWEDGAKIVMGVKTKSNTNSIIHFLRKKYYSFLRKISDVALIENATGFGIYDKQVMDLIRDINDPNPYFRGLVCELGYEIIAIEYLQEMRRSGKSKNNFFTLLDMALLGIVNYSLVPIRAASIIGIVLGLVSLIVGISLFTIKLFYWDSIPFGIAPLGIILFFFIGMIFFFIGIVGEYVASLIPYLRRRPLVIEKERINF